MPKTVEIDVESSRISMTPMRLVLLVIGCVTLATSVSSFAAEAISNAATKPDVAAAVATVKPQLEALSASDGRQNERLAALESLPSDMREIRARIDLLVYAGQDDPRRRQIMGRAAERVRSAAKARGESGDPLSGVEGL